VATHASALKAHRQSLVHRERNRRYRSQLRSTLKEIRSTFDDAKKAPKDQSTAKAQLNQAISLIDKMAGKGIIHRNTASRYKARLSARVAKKTA
jgi:small subunit ribosomal protein S20